ncbi:MAG: hypothetical protein ACRDK9_05785 [Solirubrobacterales bacterium]
MLEASSIVASVANGRRALTLAVGGLALVAVVLFGVVVPNNSSAGSNFGFNGSACENANHGHVCFWRHANYQNFRAKWDDSPGCCQWFNIYGGEAYRSAKNRFGNRKVRIRPSGSSSYICMNPGNSLSNPGAVHQFYIGQVGSRCP